MEFEVAISFFIGGKNMRHIGEKIILVLCIVFFGIAAMNLVEIGKEYYDGQKEYEELKEYTEEEPNGQQDDPTEGEAEEKTIDFAELRKINEDIVAWIQISGIGVDYPVVQGEDNEYYLHHTFRKEANKAGSIFLDYRNRADFTEQRVIIYGHNMKDGSMFSKPYIKNSNDLYFNISHSCDWIICAWSNHEIGVDLENIRHIDLDIARVQFCNDEYTYIIEFPEV